MSSFVVLTCFTWGAHPLFLQYEAASAANLPVSLLYEVDCAAIRLHIMSTIPILTFLMLYETDFADFLLYISAFGPFGSACVPTLRQRSVSPLPHTFTPGKHKVFVCLH